MKDTDRFQFPHHFFVMAFIFVYIPVIIIFNYFIEDFMYIGHFTSKGTSASAFIILVILIYLHKYLFTKKLKTYMESQNLDDYNNFIKNCKHFSVFPISLGKKDFALLSPNPDELIDVKKSIYEYGRASRIIFILWILLGPVLSLIGLVPLH